LKWPAAAVIGLYNLLIGGEKATALAQVQEPLAFALKVHPHWCRRDTKTADGNRQQ
jgi:hypothetical protein